jgi:proline iminopeptidase
MYPDLQSHEGSAPVENATLFYREIGQGRPIIIIHGGPDFDHTYLLPDMDRLSDSYRLIYYDQRGRGKSAPETHPHTVSLKTEVEDLEGLRKHLQLDSVVVLGHSWGGLLAMQYAIHYPQRVSHLILMNTASASQADYQILRKEVLGRKSVYQNEINAITSTAEYQEGDPDAVTAYYRIHYQVTIKQPEHLERLMVNMRANFTKDAILRGRAIEDQLYKETWLSREFDFFPDLKQLTTPTLVIHGDYDFVPAECAEHIAESIPGAHFVLLKDCGHFSYLESPDEVRQALADFFDNKIFD